MSFNPPTMRPRQIADMLCYLTRARFSGEIVRCWPIRHQGQAEGWADFEIRRVIICDLEHWPIGRPRKLPHSAIRHLARVKGDPR